MPGCIGEQHLVLWMCPPCHERARSPVPYPIPSRSLGGSRAGMDNRPLILYNIFFDGGDLFNVHESSAAFLEFLAQSRFVGAESNLLMLRLKFSDLALPQIRSKIQKNKTAMTMFAEKQRDSRLIISINVHSNPQDGELLYGGTRFASLCAILDHILGPCESRPMPFSNSLLFVVSCGGLMQYAMQDVQAASSCFTSTFAFGAASVDPLTVTSHFIQTVVDFHIFGCESLEAAVLRAFKPEVASHTPVYVFSGQFTARLVNATLRRRPNGEDIRCCDQIPKYLETQHRGHGKVVLLRCLVSAHPGPRNLRIQALPSEPGV
ncbi:hypothetical protein Hypma_005824 [Hypsizygus marmoreus]|uniref:Uncharacterized protein n=1 Tax=Hypsizygus marmoreus TaxID=39966 RepID=A0A369KDR8_HYPMA|nr:hypothetical protein Hypma_005824 [Hypsizygus marmoreus]